MMEAVRLLGFGTGGWATALLSASAVTLLLSVAGFALGAVFGAPLGGLLSAYASAALIKVILGSLLIWSAWKVFGKHA